MSHVPMVTTGQLGSFHLIVALAHLVAVILLALLDQSV